MDSLSSPQKTKSRKMKRISKKPRVQIILDMFFRAMEIIVVLVTVAKLSYQLVITFQDSCVAEIILANRNLAFVVGNAIVITLIAKSGILLNQELDQKCKRNDLYEEFVVESSRRDVTSRAETRNVRKQSEAENEARQSITDNAAKQSIAEKAKTRILTEKKTKQSISEKREKESKHEEMRKQSFYEKNEKQNIFEHQDITLEKTEKQSLSEKKQSPIYQRSRSEKLEGLEKRSFGKLKRSETDASSEKFDSDDDELRYKIESFIARQRRNQNDD